MLDPPSSQWPEEKDFLITVGTNAGGKTTDEEATGIDPAITSDDELDTDEWGKQKHARPENKQYHGQK